MHQDSFRSVVYRSLSKSLASRNKDGNQETVQCARTRPQKTTTPCVTVEDTVCRSCRFRGQRLSQSNQEERAMSYRESYERARTPSQMTDSFSERFAEDLLRGALDLQESLVMLERFQAMSKSVVLVNKKRKTETAKKRMEAEKIHEFLGEASGVSNGVLDDSRDSNHELRKVIKESLCRQNLVSLSSDDEKASSSQLVRYSASNSSWAKSSEQTTIQMSSPSCVSSPSSKSKSPSLIAKLMGLHEVPSEDSYPVKKDEKMKTISSPRACFDIEMPKSRKLPQPSAVNSDPNRKAYQDIIETMQFKGLLKINEADELRIHRCDVLSPKSIANPANSPCSEKEIVQQSPLSDAVSMTDEAKPVKSTPKAKATEKSNAESSQHVKSTSSAIHKQSVRETIHKQSVRETIKARRKASEEPKPHLSEKRSREKKDVKAKTVSASRTMAKVAPKPDKKPAASNTSASARRTMKAVGQDSPNSAKEKKPVPSRKIRNSTTGKTVTKYKKCEEHIETVDTPNREDGVSIETGSSPWEESCLTADQDTEPCLEDAVTEKEWSTSFETERTHSSGEVATQPLTEKGSRTEEDKDETNDEIILLLLSDKSFLSRAQELFGIDIYKHPNHHSKAAEKSEMMNCRLCLDTAGELLERKHQQKYLCCRSFQSQNWRKTACFTLQELVKEISSGTRKLSSYTDKDCSSKDSLYIKLERDLRSADVAINNMWDVGWLDWIFMEDVEDLVRDVEEHVLSVIINEVFIDLVI